MEQYNGQGNGGNGPDEAVDAWVRVVDLANEIAVDPRAMRRWISRNLSASAQKRVLRPDGGHPELWVCPSAVGAIKGHYQGGINGTDTQRAAVDLGDDQGAKGTDAVSDGAEGWKAAVSAAESLVSELRQELDRLRGETAAELERVRRELSAEKQQREQVQRQADESERARAAYAERLAEERAAWWQWCAYIKGLGILRRLRGIPQPPEELTTGTKRLETSKG